MLILPVPHADQKRWPSSRRIESHASQRMSEILDTPRKGDIFEGRWWSRDSQSSSSQSNGRSPTAGSTRPGKSCPPGSSSMRETTSSTCLSKHFKVVQKVSGQSFTSSNVDRAAATNDKQENGRAESSRNIRQCRESRGAYYNYESRMRPKHNSPTTAIQRGSTEEPRRQQREQRSRRRIYEFEGMSIVHRHDAKRAQRQGANGTVRTSISNLDKSHKDYCADDICNAAGEDTSSMRTLASVASCKNAYNEVSQNTCSRLVIPARSGTARAKSSSRQVVWNSPCA